MIELLSHYHPTFFRNLLICYAIVLVLAMIRYGFEKVGFFENLLFSISMFIISMLIAMQYSNKGLKTSTALAERNWGIGWGATLLLYAFMLIIVFVIRCLFVKTNSIKIYPKTNEIEILSSTLWGTVMVSIIWGSLMLSVFGLGSFVYFLDNIKSDTIARMMI